MSQDSGEEFVPAIVYTNDQHTILFSDCFKQAFNKSKPEAQDPTFLDKIKSCVKLQVEAFEIVAKEQGKHMFKFNLPKFALEGEDDNEEEE